MKFDLQPTLSNELIKIRPLEAEDFEALYKVASDPLLWAQHPNQNRYQLTVFETFFKGALESKGAIIVADVLTGAIIGCSRYYDFDEENSSILIGYTFLDRNYWGKSYNYALKKIMFNYAFQFIDKIMLHIGETNYRSQKSIERIGAKKIGVLEVAYYGEPTKTNFVYQVNKELWINN